MNFRVLIRIFGRIFGMIFGTIRRRAGRRIFRGTFGRTDRVRETFGSGLEVSRRQSGGGNSIQSGNGSIGKEVGCRNM